MQMNRLAFLAAALLALPAYAQAPPPPRVDITPQLGTSEAQAAPQPAPQPAAAAADRQPRLSELLETHIEEVRHGNRVTEIRVTGADGSPRFTMENRDQRQPSQLDSQRPGLSVPNFLNIQF
jgi:hypothetical protein